MNKIVLKSFPLVKWARWYFLRNRVLSKNKGKHIKINDGAYILNSELSDYNVFYPNVSVNNSSLGKFVYIDSFAIINHTHIGNFCSIGPSCRIGLFKHPPHYISTSPVFFSLYKQCGITFADDFYYNEYEDVYIGNDVWIGANVLIADGVNIGDGAIIAAGAVVTRNVEPYTIVGGVPARCIKKRFSELQIEQLLKLKWWYKDIDWIKDNWKFFNKSNAFFSEFV